MIKATSYMLPMQFKVGKNPVLLQALWCVFDSALLLDAPASDSHCGNDSVLPNALPMLSP